MNRIKHMMSLLALLGNNHFFAFCLRLALSSPCMLPATLLLHTLRLQHCTLEL